MIVYQHHIERVDLQANPRVLYIFGDNLLRTGMAGQAAAMRGEPNAIGVATKKAPGMNEADFFTDAEVDANVRQMIVDIAPGCVLNLANLYSRLARLAVRMREESQVYVVPLDGIGTGLSQLPARAPETFAALAGLGLAGPHHHA